MVFEINVMYHWHANDVEMHNKKEQNKISFAHAHGFVQCVLFIFQMELQDIIETLI